MCGIAGSLAFRQDTSITPYLLRRMTDAIQHRGPDGEGIFVSGQIGLAHRRLAIIDLSENARQPMAGPQGTTQIVFNGEIYNFRELRAELEAKGHRFHTESDTEVILHAYEEYGPDCVTHFNGMFAFALWDEKGKRLFLARDRFGIKPLYFVRTTSTLAFASEIKALLVFLDKKPEPNQRLIYDFLTLGILDHTDETFFNGIQKLPASHYMLVDEKGNTEIRRYWDFEVSTSVPRVQHEQAVEKSREFFDRFAEAVDSHLVSDVPVGSCLSGGLDSSAVVSVIHELVGQHKATAVGPRQQTFSACYSDSAFDEQVHIDRVIAWTGAQSHKVFPRPEEFRAALPKLLWHQEEPFATTSIFAQWEVMRTARDRGVTVLLDGQGADEQLLGYRKFYAFYIRALLRGNQSFLALKEFFQHFGSRKVLRTLQLRRGLRYLPGQRIGSVAVAHGFLRQPFAKRFHDDASVLEIGDDLGARIKADMTRWSLPVLLRYEDKNSMAFSRESRVPFLDHHLVEFIAGLPLNLKLRDGWTKYCLRAGAQNRMPAEILRRKDKLGFATPEEDWIHHTLKNDLHETFERAVFLPEFIKVPALIAHFDGYLRGRRPLLASEFFLRYFILEHWAKVWL